MRAALILAALAGPAVAAPVEPATSWYVITAPDGAVIGHGAHMVAGAEITDSQEMLLQENGGPATRMLNETVTRVDAAGRPVSITDNSRNGRSWALVTAVIQADAAQLTRESAGDRRSLRVALPPDVRFDNGAGLLAGWDPARTPRLVFDNFSMDAMAVERVTIEPVPGATQAGEMIVLRKRYDKSELRSVARLTLDAQRRIVAVAQPMFGTSVTIRAADQATALAEHPPWRVLGNVMTKSPFRIPPTAVLGHIRYRFSFRDGIAFAPPDTGEQRVTQDAEGVTLDICGGCGPGLASDAVTLADALRPAPWLQSDHPRIRAVAAPVARMHVTDSRKMELLAGRVREQIPNVDFSGHYSALEAMQRGAGDCTEDAVLLAALGRAAGIPTRVVNGLVYSRERYHGVSNVFMPHSWTLAWVDGKWRSFDAAMLGFDATHVALTVGDGDARSLLAAGQLASLLRWDTMTEVKPRPTG